MNKILSFTLIVLTAIIFGCTKVSTEVGEKTFPEGKLQHVVRAKDIQWLPCPPNLPQACEMSVLEGKPKSKDLFTVRIKVSGEFVVPAHTHPKHERVTVLQGKVYVGFGKNAVKEEAKVFKRGDYYVNSRNAIHTVWADSSTVIQITSIGPWETHFIEE